MASSPAERPAAHAAVLAAEVSAWDGEAVADLVALFKLLPPDGIEWLDTASRAAEVLDALESLAGK